jgi:sentrin-specific protease 7
MPLVFNRATVNKEDIPRLDEGQCLNDNLIGFGLRYLFDKYGGRHTDLHKRVYLHNTFFYEKLKAGRNINYDGVKSWTAKVDLLSYDYIVVPVNEHFHWWVAIICNPGKLDPDLRGTPTKTAGSSGAEVENKGDKTSSDVETADMVDKRPVKSTDGVTIEERDLVKSDIVDLVSDGKDVSIDLTAGARAKQIRNPRTPGKTDNAQDPKIITLDSLGSSHPQAVTHLKKYLLAEFKHKRNKIITDVPSHLGMRASSIPEQNNLCDCGVYLLGYIQEFVKSPDLFIRTLLRREAPDWDFNPSALREMWRDTINIEHKMYQDRQLAGQQRRSESSGTKRTPNGGSAGSSCRPSREASMATNGQKNAAGSRMDSSEPTASPKTSTTPANSSSDQDPASDGPARSSTPAAATSSPQQAHRRAATAPQSQESLETPEEDSVVIIAPQDSQDGGAVLPSIEAPEVEEVHRPSKEEGDGEPPFIAKLPSSSTQASTSDDEDDDHVAEVDPKSFYHQPRPTSKRGDAQSSPVRTQHRRRKATVAATTRPAHHTSSRFVVDGSSPQPGDDIPVVQTAELVRHSDTIDLT